MFWVLAWDIGQQPTEEALDGSTPGNQLLATTERRRKEMLQKFFAKMQKEGGQGLTEYALILVLVSVAMVGGLTLLSGGISNAYSAVVSALTPTP